MILGINIYFYLEFVELVCYFKRYDLIFLALYIDMMNKLEF
jgi:hypothetical protein